MAGRPAIQADNGGDPAGATGRMVVVLTVILCALFAFNSLTRFRSYSPDSMNYVDVARNVLAGKGLVQSAIGYNHPKFLGAGKWPEPFIAQPPLYPLAVAALGFVGLEPAAGALLLPALAFGGIVLAGALLAFRCGGMASALLAAAALSWYFPLNDVCRRAWSDGVGTLFVTLGLALLVPFFDDRRSRARRALALGLVCGLAFATRYALAAFAVFSFAALCIATWRDWRETARNMCAWVAGALPLPALIMTHNYRSAGLLFPLHNPSTATLMDLLRDMGLVVLQYTNRLETAGLAAGIAAILLLGIYLRENVGRASPPAGARLILGWIVWYLCFVIWQRFRLHFDDISPRLLLPALAPVAVMVAIWIGGGVRKRAMNVLRIASFGGLFLAAARETMVLATTQPVEVASRIMRSPRLQFVKQHVGPDDLVIGNDPLDVVFYLRHVNVISFSPHPYTQYADHDALVQFLAANRSRYRNAFIVFRDFNGGDPARIHAQFGPFIGNLVASGSRKFDDIDPVGVYGDTHAFRVETAPDKMSGMGLMPATLPEKKEN